MRSLRVRRKGGYKTGWGEASEIEIEPGECNVLEAQGRTDFKMYGIVRCIKSYWKSSKLRAEKRPLTLMTWRSLIYFAKTNVIKTSILSSVKQITSPGWMHETHASVLRAGALGRPRGMGWGGRREGGSGWGTHVNLWLIHVNVWQKPLQYYKVISLQLIKINEKKKKWRNLIKGSRFSDSW